MTDSSHLAIEPDQPMDWADLEALRRPPAIGWRGPQRPGPAAFVWPQRREVRVVLYRDHHAWCPYCQKVWLWLEERQVPYRIEKVTMFCYGEKEAWFKRLVPSGMLPALALDGQLITESDRILLVLEAAFGPWGCPWSIPHVGAAPAGA